MNTVYDGEPVDRPLIDKISPFLHAQKVLEYLASEGLPFARADLDHEGKGQLTIFHLDRMNVYDLNAITIRLEQLLPTAQWRWSTDCTALMLILPHGWRP